jgi:hypothetical protein
MASSFPRASLLPVLFPSHRVSLPLLRVLTILSFPVSRSCCRANKTSQFACSFPALANVGHQKTTRSFSFFRH